VWALALHTAFKPLTMSFLEPAFAIATVLAIVAGVARAHRSLVALVRLADADVDRLARLIDPQLLLAAVALTDRLDDRDQVGRDPLLLHAPSAERLRCNKRVAMRVDRARLRERR
jgi:hypothetical protein